MPAISLPEALHAAAEQAAAREGFANAEAYVVELVRRELGEQDADSVLRRAMAGEGEDPRSIPQEAVDRRKREIEALLVEGLESGPATPMTAEDWEGIRRRVRERREWRNGAEWQRSSGGRLRSRNCSPVESSRPTGGRKVLVGLEDSTRATGPFMPAFPVEGGGEA